ncbi:MAG: hypothetical protein E7464_08195 [Ruminococcaceae bacterium]|nr:hypothetical protein [Oscillospiraceae bacterium]
MTTKVKNILLVCLMGVFLFGMAAWCVFKAPTAYSEGERRVLAVFPEITAESLADTSFMKNFETYTQDQFPLREVFRSVKAMTATYALGQMDNNDLYYVDGHLAKLEYPLNQEMLDHAAGRFQFLYDHYLAGTDTEIYFSVVPDKNYFLAEPNGYLHIDYEELVSCMRDKTPYMNYIDIFPLLTLEDYYTTDSHWRQEEICHVADWLLSEMGAEGVGSADYTVNELDTPFYGVYYGQSALHVKPDTIRYLTNDVLEQCIVTANDNGMPEESVLYDMEAAHGRDPYEMFSAGSCAIVTIENPNAKTDEELVIFRDSFAGSLAPLLVEEYAKITMVDIRYVQSDLLSFFLEFDDQDVLFLYSASLLNNSLGLK